MKESDSDNPDVYGSSSKRLRSSTEGMFNFRERCLFCGEKLPSHTTLKESKQMERHLSL